MLNSYDQEEEGRERGAGPAGYSYYTDEDLKYFSSDDELEEELYAAAMGYGLVTPEPEVGVVTKEYVISCDYIHLSLSFKSSSNSLQTHNGSLATVGHEGMDISVSLQVQVPHKKSTVCTGYIILYIYMTLLASFFHLSFKNMYA